MQQSSSVAAVLLWCEEDHNVSLKSLLLQLNAPMLQEEGNSSHTLRLQNISSRLAFHLVLQSVLLLRHSVVKRLCIHMYHRQLVSKDYASP